MDLFDTAKAIAKEFPTLSLFEIRDAIEFEAKVIVIEDGLNGRGQSLETAADRIRKWIGEAEEIYSLHLTNLPQFVSTHRTACVWAVLRGIELKGYEIIIRKKN